MENVDLMPTSHGSLWTLILGSVMFLASFVMYLSLIQPLYNARGNYLAINAPTGAFQGSNVNVFSNMTSNFTIAFGDPAKQLSIGDNVVAVTYAPEGYFGGYVLLFGHVDRFWPLTTSIMSLHNMVSNDGSGDVKISTLMSPTHYNNNSAIESSKFTMVCEHVTLDIIITSAANTSLADTFRNGQKLNIYYSFSIDFTKMSSNVWMLMANVLTFNSIRTGEVVVDGALNVLVGVPCYVAIIYVIYRLVAGLIPTVSGGGGQ